MYYLVADLSFYGKGQWLTDVADLQCVFLIWNAAIILTLLTDVVNNIYYLNIMAPVKGYNILGKITVSTWCSGSKKNGPA